MPVSTQTKSSSSTTSTSSTAINKPVMDITTPLKADLLFHRMSAREELGRISEYEIDVLSMLPKITPTQILAKPVTVRLESATGNRFFHGYVTRFSHVGTHGRHQLYHASVRPWLWFLTRTADCRIFQNKTVKDIITEIFQKHTIADFEFNLKGHYEKWDYCVQYRETDFNFVSRLMEQEGMYYYVRHEESRHTVVIADSNASHPKYDGYADIPYIPLDRIRPEQEGITRWTYGFEVQPGAYMVDDYNFEEPPVPRRADRKDPREHELASYEIYDYPGEFDKLEEGKVYARTRLEEQHSRYEVAYANTTARGLCTGYTFKMREFPRADLNREYLVIAASYELNGMEHEATQGAGTGYTCSFTAVAAGQAFRSARTTPKPIVQGPQTAVVVGPKGDEIYTDKYGRIKVQFHWDRLGKKNQDSSCWMRVAQVWAGNRWGATFIPRIGQEVVVSFLEGDPDQPLVTGSVYNAVQMPPYLGEGRDGKHEHDPHVSGVKTNSTKGGDGFNELRFDDTKGKEQIFIHAERNYDVRVKNDMMERVIHDRNSVVGAEKDGAKSGDERIKVFQDRHDEVLRHEIVKIGKNREEFIEGDYDHVVKGTYKEAFRSDQHIVVKGKKAEKVDGNVSLTAGKNLYEKVGLNTAIESGMEIHLKAGMKVIIEAGAQLSLKGPGGFIDIGPAGVTIQGTMVLINSGGAAGSGSGCSPDAPEDAKEASPTTPVIADDSKSGSKSSPD